MEDPYYRDNEDKGLALMNHDFVYRTVFVPVQESLTSDKIYLHCEGLIRWRIYTETK